MTGEDRGGMGRRAKRLTAVLRIVPLLRFVSVPRGWTGRPAKHRLASASVFVAKAVLTLGTTRRMIERLQNNEQLRHLC